MEKFSKRVFFATAAASIVAMSLFTTGCFGPSDADVASQNLSKAAEQFEVFRHIVGINGITDKYLIEVVGFCSIESGADTGVAGTLEITCKVGEKDGHALVKKTYLGRSDNVTYVVTQANPTSVSTDHYRVIFKPEALIPNIDRP